jgi:capsular polysaccharide biosynthesis protein
VYAAVKSPTYTAKAYVVAVAAPAESGAALNFAQAYGRIATSGPVLAKARTGLTDDTGLRDVTAATSPDAPVIEITATASSARHAAGLANAVAGALADYGSVRRTETNVGLSLLAGATTPERPSSPRPPLELAVGACAGLLVGGLAVLAGAGRKAATDETATEEADAAEPVRYEADLAEEAATTGQIERYTGVAWAERAPKVIAAYRASASPVVDARDQEPAIPVQRIVGRAPVSGMDDE